MRIHLVFDVSLLEPYHSFTFPRKIHDPPPPIEIDGEQEHEVEDILDSQVSHHQLEYLVHWHGYDMNNFTWELIKNLSNVMEKVHQFH
jgi:hypothetical protein